VAIAGVTLTHPDRVLYPGQGITKRDLAAFYEEIGDWILPHVVERPLSLVRCPAGQGTACFYQKHVGPEASDSIEGVKIKEKGAVRTYAYIETWRDWSVSSRWASSKCIHGARASVTWSAPTGSRSTSTPRPGCRGSA